MAGVPLKCDARGRVRSTSSQRETVLAEFARSGLSGPAFARLAGIPYQTFTYWRQQRRRLLCGETAIVSTHETAAPALRHFVEAVPVLRPQAGTTGAQALRVELPGGCVLCVADTVQALLAARLIQALNLRDSC